MNFFLQEPLQLILHDELLSPLGSISMPGFWAAWFSGKQGSGLPAVLQGHLQRQVSLKTAVTGLVTSSKLQEVLTSSAIG